MSRGRVAPTVTSFNIEWLWQSNSDPSQPGTWTKYSDVENRIIEEAYTANRDGVTLDNCHLNLKEKTHIPIGDSHRSGPIKRVALERNNTHIREERFMFDPVAPKRSYGLQYGWISPFIQAVRQELNLETEKLPSQDKTVIPMIVERACRGIIEEGKENGQQRTAEWMANKLMSNKYKEIEEIWTCCARLYTMETFLYKKLNETMRLIGDNMHEHLWRRKVSTLGPFALLLWDDPLNKEPKVGKQLLYRGISLNAAQIAMYKECCGESNEYRSFQAFTSCTRNRAQAEMFGNVLLIMEMHYAFTANLQPYSDYSNEEEELLFPGVCFTVQRVQYDKIKNRHLIYLNMKQRFNG